LAALAELVKKHEVKALAIGLPLNMDGTEGPRCQSIRQFAANIAAHAPPGARCSADRAAGRSVSVPLP
jgi:putative Holliday junction resolvase